jgi:hypothetical protein
MQVMIEHPSEFRLALQAIVFRETRVLMLIYAEIDGALTQAALEVACATVIRGNCVSIWGRWSPTDVTANADEEARIACLPGG